MLLSLEAWNFQKHSHIEAEFSPGTNLIVGDNWAGKSTLMRAILFAFFGPAVIPGGAKLLQQRGASKRPKARVVFSLPPHLYDVTRSASTCVLLRDGKEVATGAAVVTQEIEALFGLSGKWFSQLRYAPQEEAAAILTLGAAKLAGVINEITQVDLVDRVVELAGEKKAQCEAKLGAMPDIDVAAMEAELSSLLQQLTAEYAELTAALAAVADKQAAERKAAAEHEELTRRLAAWESFSRGRKAKEIELRANEQRLALLQETPEADLAALEAAEAALSEELALVGAALSRAVQAKQAAAAADQRLGRAKLTHAGLEGRYAGLLDAVEKYPDHAATVSEEAGLRQELEALNHRAAEAAVQLQLAQEAYRGGVCSACSRPFDASHDPQELQRRIAAAERERDETLAEAAKVSAALATCTANATGRRSTEQRAEEAKLALEQAAEEVRAAEAEMAGLEPPEDAQIQEMTEAANLLQQRLSVAGHATITARRAAEELASVKAALAVAKRELESKPTDPQEVRQEQVTSTMEALRSAWAESQSTSSVAAGLQTAYAVKHHEYQGKATQVAQAKAAVQGRQELADTAAACTDLTKYLRKNRDRFLEQTWSDLLAVASQFVSQATGGAITAVARDAEGNFQYEEEGQWMPAAAASGLQKAILGVGVRLALAEAIRTPAQFCLLDEVTAGARDENSMAVIQALSSIGQQAVVITHRQADAAVANSVVTV